jgi:hypothetical protein
VPEVPAIYRDRTMRRLDAQSGESEPTAILKRSRSRSWIDSDGAADVHLCMVLFQPSLDMVEVCGIEVVSISSNDVFRYALLERGILPKGDAIFLL